MSVVSKRQQARNERELQQLLQTVPGNNVCADCQARNPGWASWNLGIFLCMRCASIHRKLGTHISKVKSLSMDTWTTDQVESMRNNGNVAVNKSFNPKNKSPDIPLDVDEVDSAMERFIRKKYQDKSLSSGKPQPPARSPTMPQRPGSPDDSSPPPLPPKKGKFFGFGLRAVSSSSHLSRNDRKKLPPAPVHDDAIGTSSEIFSQSGGSYGLRAEPRQGQADEEFGNKLAMLRDMGFPDDRLNGDILGAMGGNLQRTIGSLVKMGQVGKPSSPADMPTSGLRHTSSSIQLSSDARSQTPNPRAASTNPFDAFPTAPTQTFGLSVEPLGYQQQPSSFKPAPQAVPVSGSNPFHPPERSQTDLGLQQAFQGMQINQPLFPHSTGGYPPQPPPFQDPRFQHSMTPPVPLMHQQSGFAASPAAITVNTNPFFQSMQPPQPAFNGPFASMSQNSPATSNSSNPFLQQNSPFTPTSPGQQTSLQQPPQSQNFNPFGIPPSGAPSPPQTVNQPVVSNQSLFNPPQPTVISSGSTPQYISQPSQTQSTSLQNQQQPFANFQYTQGLPPNQAQFQRRAQPQMYIQQQHQPQPQYLQQQQFQPIATQQTGRIDKSSIMALYNYPHLAPQTQPEPLASIPEPAEDPSSSAAPYDPFSSLPSLPSKRSATMPVNLHSAGSRNPFLNSTLASKTSSTLGGPMANGGGGSGYTPSYRQGVGARHASAESVSVNNAALEGGRHSPDAWAGLSARYG